MANALLLGRHSFTESVPEQLPSAHTEADLRMKSCQEWQAYLLVGKPVIRLSDTSSDLSTGGIVTLIGPTTGTSGVDLLFNSSNWIYKFEFTKQLFSLLISARGDARNYIYEALKQADPAVLLSIALAEYYERGNIDRLTLAASLLTDMGVYALPALRDLARSNLPECELFIDVMAHLRGVSRQDRLDTLGFLIHNPNVDVRFGLLEALRAFVRHEAAPLLHTLADDKDEDLAEEARARLESMSV